MENAGTPKGKTAQRELDPLTNGRGGGGDRNIKYGEHGGQKSEEGPSVEGKKFLGKNPNYERKNGLWGRGGGKTRSGATK